MPLSAKATQSFVTSNVMVKEDKMIMANELHAHYVHKNAHVDEHALNEMCSLLGKRVEDVKDHKIALLEQKEAAQLHAQAQSNAATAIAAANEAMAKALDASNKLAQAKNDILSIVTAKVKSDADNDVLQAEAEANEALKKAQEASVKALDAQNAFTDVATKIKELNDAIAANTFKDALNAAQVAKTKAQEIKQNLELTISVAQEALNQGMASINHSDKASSAVLNETAELRKKAYIAQKEAQEAYTQAEQESLKADHAANEAANKVQEAKDLAAKAKIEVTTISIGIVQQAAKDKANEAEVEAGNADAKAQSTKLYAQNAGNKLTEAATKLKEMNDAIAMGESDIINAAKKFDEAINVAEEVKNKCQEVMNDCVDAQNKAKEASVQYTSSTTKSNEAIEAVNNEKEELKKIAYKAWSEAAEAHNQAQKDAAEARKAADEAKAKATEALKLAVEARTAADSINDLTIKSVAVTDASTAEDNARIADAKAQTAEHYAQTAKNAFDEAAGKLKDVNDAIYVGDSDATIAAIKYEEAFNVASQVKTKAQEVKDAFGDTQTAVRLNDDACNEVMKLTAKIGFEFIKQEINDKVLSKNTDLSNAQGDLADLATNKINALKTDLDSVSNEMLKLIQSSTLRGNFTTYIKAAKTKLQEATNKVSEAEAKAEDAGDAIINLSLLQTTIDDLIKTNKFNEAIIQMRAINAKINEFADKLNEAHNTLTAATNEYNFLLKEAAEAFSKIAEDLAINTIPAHITAANGFVWSADQAEKNIKKATDKADNASKNVKQPIKNQNKVTDKKKATDEAASKIKSEAKKANVASKEANTKATSAADKYKEVVDAMKAGKYAEVTTKAKEVLDYAKQISKLVKNVENAKQAAATYTTEAEKYATEAENLAAELKISTSMKDLSKLFGWHKFMGDVLTIIETKGTIIQPALLPGTSYSIEDLNTGVRETFIRTETELDTSKMCQHSYLKDLNKLLLSIKNVDTTRLFNNSNKALKTKEDQGRLDALLKNLKDAITYTNKICNPKPHFHTNSYEILLKKIINDLNEYPLALKKISVLGMGSICNTNVKVINENFKCAITNQQLWKVKELDPLRKAIGETMKEAWLEKGLSGTFNKPAFIANVVTPHCNDVSHKAEDICVLHTQGYLEEIIDLTITEGYI